MAVLCSSTIKPRPSCPRLINKPKQLNSESLGSCFFHLTIDHIYTADLNVSNSICWHHVLDYYGMGILVLEFDSNHVFFYLFCVDLEPTQ